MKTTRLLLTAWLATMSLTMQAQFNTVAHRPTHYIIDMVNDPVDTATQTVQPTTPAMSESEPSADSITAVRKQWIVDYMSVSYPLADIHITSLFGERTDPFTGKRKQHNGLDLRSPEGTEVYAVMFGQVSKVGWDGRSGNYVTIRHGKYSVSYCHLSKILVEQGQIVNAGETVALAGQTGRATGSHLHFVLRKGRKNLNPQILLDYVRLTKEKALAMLAQ